MKNIYFEINGAKKQRDRIEKLLANLEKQKLQFENKLREGLPVSEYVPCSVGILPDGAIVVHVWVNGSSTPNQLHIVQPGFVNFDGTGREANRLEQAWRDGEVAYVENTFKRYEENEVSDE